MAKPDYRVLFNADCTWPFIQAPDPVTPEGVSRIVDAVAKGGADVFLVNPNAQKVNYPSKVWERFWDTFTPGDLSTVICGQGNPQSTHDMLLKMQCLAEQCDYLEMMLARCRQNGIGPGVTIRMNDMHDAPWAPKTWLFSTFYREHPQYYIKESVETVEGPRDDWQGKPYENLKRQSKIARFAIPNGLIVDKANRLVLRSEVGTEITVLGIEVRVAGKEHTQ